MQKLLLAKISNKRPFLKPEAVGAYPGGRLFNSFRDRVSNSSSGAYLRIYGTYVSKTNAEWNNER